MDSREWDRMMLAKLRNEPTWQNAETGEWDVPKAKENPDCVCDHCEQALGITWTEIWQCMRETRCPNWPVLCVGCAISYFDGTAQVLDAIENYVHVEARLKWLDNLAELFEKQRLDAQQQMNFEE